LLIEPDIEIARRSDQMEEVNLASPDRNPWIMGVTSLADEVAC